MKKVMSESGFLTQDGQTLLNSFMRELSSVLESRDVTVMDHKNLQTFGSVLQKIVADQFSEKLRKIK